MRGRPVRGADRGWPCPCTGRCAHDTRADRAAVRCPERARAGSRDGRSDVRLNDAVSGRSSSPPTLDESSTTAEIGTPEDRTMVARRAGSPAKPRNAWPAALWSAGRGSEGRRAVRRAGPLPIGAHLADEAGPARVAQTARAGGSRSSVRPGRGGGKAEIVSWTAVAGVRAIGPRSETIGRTRSRRRRRSARPKSHAGPSIAATVRPATSPVVDHPRCASVGAASSPPGEVEKWPMSVRPRKPTTARADHHRKSRRRRRAGLSRPSYTQGHSMAASAVEQHG